MHLLFFAHVFSFRGSKNFFSGFFKLALRTQLGLLRQYSPKQTPKESQTSEKKKAARMYSRNSTNTAQNDFVLSFAFHSFMFPTLPKVAIEPPLDHSTNFVLSFALPSFMFPTSPRVASGPHRMASWPISHLSSCPIGRLSGWPGCRGWLVGQPRHPMPWLVGWLASWSGWPLVGWMAVGWLAGWLVAGWMDAVRWLAGCRGWLVGQPRHPMPWLVGWMAVGWPGCRGWLVGWLAGWPTMPWLAD